MIRVEDRFGTGEKIAVKYCERMDDGTLRDISEQEWREYSWHKATTHDDPPDLRVFKRGLGRSRR